MWFYFALGSAGTNAVANIARRTHGSLARPVELAWWSIALSLPFSIIIVFLQHGPLWTSHAFILPDLASALLCTFASVLLFTAYKYGQASVISPLGNLVPIALIFSSFIMFHTLPSPHGLVALLLIVCGVYYISVSGKHNLLHPFAAIWHQRGSRAMLSCVLLWSVSTNLDKIALRSVSPAFDTLVILGFEFILLSLYLAAQPKTRTERVLRRWWRHLIVIALFTTLAVYFQTVAIKTASTSFVLAVKRLDTLLIVLYAGFILKEKHLLRRFIGSLVAVLGVALLYFWQ